MNKPLDHTYYLSWRYCFKEPISVNLHRNLVYILELTNKVSHNWEIQALSNTFKYKYAFCQIWLAKSFSKEYF